MIFKSSFSFVFAAVLLLSCLFYTNIGHTEEKAIRLVILGDSLTAGYGLDERDSFPSQLERALRQKGRNVNVINAGVSGDTTAGGLERLDWALAEGVDVLAVALGANDGLRGVNPDFSKRNLEEIIKKAKAKDQNIKVLLIGMLAPPNLGEGYAQRFNAMYPSLAKAYNLPLYPFFLEGVATDASLNQNDGIHPNAKGISVMVERSLGFFEENL